MPYKGMCKDVLTEKLLAEHEQLKAANGMTLKDLLAVAVANPNDKVGLLLESDKSFATFKGLYAAVATALNKATTYDFLSAYKSLSNDMPGLNIPPLPAGVTGVRVDVSRNLHWYPFPAYATVESRAAVFAKLDDMFRLFRVRVRKQQVGTVEGEDVQV